jgi:hypothetical protein
MRGSLPIKRGMPAMMSRTSVATAAVPASPALAEVATRWLSATACLNLWPVLPRQYAAFRQQLEAEGAGERRCLDELDLDAVAKAMHFACARADHGMARLVVVEIVGAQRAHRHEPVGAGLVELDEQPGAGDAGDAPVEGRADAVGQPMGD